MFLRKILLSGLVFKAYSKFSFAWSKKGMELSSSSFLFNFVFYIFQFLILFFIFYLFPIFQLLYCRLNILLYLKQNPNISNKNIKIKKTNKQKIIFYDSFIYLLNVRTIKHFGTFKSFCILFYVFFKLRKHWKRLKIKKIKKIKKIQKIKKIKKIQKIKKIKKIQCFVSIEWKDRIWCWNMDFQKN